MQEHLNGGQSWCNTYIQYLYSNCLWRDGDLDQNRNEVRTPDGQKHVFHWRRISRNRNGIAGALMRMSCDESIRSRGGGCHWAYMIHPNDSYPNETDSPTVRLLALGIAIGYVTVEWRELPHVIGKSAYAVVEDRRIKHTARFEM